MRKWLWQAQVEAVLTTRFPSAVTKAVHGHGNDYDEAGDDFLQPIGHAYLSAPRANYGHDQGTDDGSGN